MKTKTVELKKNESWWGGVVNAGTRMPFAAGEVLDLRGQNYGNQASPLLVSNQGRYVWSEQSFGFELSKASLKLEGNARFIVEHTGATLRDAYLSASGRFFPPSGKIPDPLFFTAPQYNTWIELHSDQSQAAILNYAETLLREGYEPGVLMIDEGWQRYFGDWTFRPDCFPDPGGMVRQLHDWGFKVMLWVIPFVVSDSPAFRMLRQRGALVLNADGFPALREWWNGFSAVVDMTGGEGRSWFLKQLKALQKEFGIDGFKFDGGDSRFYRDDDLVALPGEASSHCQSFGELGTKFRLNEYRACWKCGGQPLAQRLQDKLHSWDDRGLGSVVPNTIAQGLMGHAFTCPDMIGGGEYRSFAENSRNLDQELFVRYAQASALMPMMQFSAAPWRVLDEYHSGLCRQAAELHVKFRRKILSLARESAKSGEPIVRHLEYQFPNMGYEKVTDQFLLGPDILVAPVLEKGAVARQVMFPPGVWKDDAGNEYVGPACAKVSAPLECLPYFLRKKQRGRVI